MYCSKRHRCKDLRAQLLMRKFVTEPCAAIGDGKTVLVKMNASMNPAALQEACLLRCLPHFDSTHMIPSMWRGRTPANLCELAPRIAAHHLGLNPTPIQLTDAHCETCLSGPLLSFSKSCKHIMEHSTMRTKCNCTSSPRKYYLHIKHLNVHFRYCEQYVTRVLVLLSEPASNLDF